MLTPTFSRALHDSPSPIAFCLSLYREFMRDRARHQHVADWNAIPALVVSHASKMRVNAGPQTEKVQTKLVGSMFASNARDGADPYVDQYALRNHDIKCMMRENHISADVNLFTLPGDNDMQQLPPLPAVETVDDSLRRYHLAVCNIMGVPASMVVPSERGASGTSAAHAGQAAFNVNSRMFGNSMRNVSTLLQQLMQDVYKTIYGGQCEFHVTPVAKMEIQTFEDLESAVRSGAVTMDLLANIAHSLGSDFPAPRCVCHISYSLVACATVLVNACRGAGRTPHCRISESGILRCRGGSARRTPPLPSTATSLIAALRPAVPPGSTDNKKQRTS